MGIFLQQKKEAPAAHLQDKVLVLVKKFLLHLRPDGVEARIWCGFDALVGFWVTIPVPSGVLEFPCLSFLGLPG